MAAQQAEEEEEHVPPDGGYGWVVVGALFAISFMTFGITYSIGTIFDVLVVELECTDSILALSASTCYALQSLLASLVSPMQRILSHRVMVLWGVVICSIALIASAFVPVAFALLFTFGVIGGLGSAVIYLPIVVIVPFYFAKRQAIASAISMGGSFAGVFVFPYVMRFLVSVYDWRGALFVLSAVQLNSAAAALLLLPVEKTMPKLQPAITETSPAHENHAEVDEDLINSNIALATFIEENIAGCQPANGKRAMSLNKRSLHDALVEAQMARRALEAVRRQKSSLDDSLEETDAPFQRNVSVVSNESGKVPREAFRRNKATSELHPRPRFDSGRAYRSGALGSLSQRMQRQASKASRVSVASSTSGLDNVYGSAFALMAAAMHNVSVADSSDRLTLGGDEKATSDEGHQRKATGLAARYVGLLRNCRFMSFVFATFLKGFIFLVPSLFIVNYATSVGIPQHQRTILMSLIGVGNVVGRPLLAYVSDYHLASHRPLFSAGVLFVLGVATLFVSLIKTFHYLATSVFLNGFILGFFQTQMVAVTTDMLPSLSMLVLALPILLVSEGAGYLVGAPLLALLPSYEATFGASGLVILAMALIMAGIEVAPPLAAFCLEQRREKKARTENEDCAKPSLI